MMLDSYKNKKVVLTGHTGFKGAWLALWLKSLGAEVLGYSLESEYTPSLFKIFHLDKDIKSVIGNILDAEKLHNIFKNFNPDIVFHLAAQPLVRRSYIDPVLTYSTNVMGTLNVLEAAKSRKSVRAFVNVTTDKCYENQEKIYFYKENDPMGGYDMYSSSKACSEILTSSYRRSFLKDGFLLATGRAGNVIGGGDWACDRLIPDCVRAIYADKPIVLRNPNAVRPWQHVFEPLGGYLLLGEKLLNGEEEFACSYNFGPEKENIKTVEEIVNEAVKNFGKGKVEIKKDDEFHEAQLLMLDTQKAKSELGFKTLYGAQEAVKKTASWYKNYYENKDDTLEFSLMQLKDYQNKCFYRELV